MNGPFLCGLYPDLVIAQRGLIGALDYGEVVIADKAYRDGHFMILQGMI